jgi:putative nucleotidyltransferase with HDIG domain
MNITVDLNQVILALTDALDLVGIDENAHGKRVGYMACMCAEHLQLDKPGRERLFNIGLLHDIGVSSSREHTHLVSELQWEGAQDHAIEGARLLGDFAPLHDFAEVVRHHHTAWSALAQHDGIDPLVRRDANLVFLVDRIDSMAASHYGVDLLEAVTGIRQQAQGLARSLFSPELVELFLQVSSSDAFWMMLESPHLERFIFETERRFEPRPLSNSPLRQLAGIFAYVVDAKSAFTVRHSYGVASLSRQLAQLAQLSDLQVDKIEIAGLLHDIGKLRIPDEMLEKPGPLDDPERRVMHRHSFETYQVLRRIDGLADIALWAAYHHETTDGAGYPFRRGGSDLGVEARIIAVADIFQALAQERPYRGALPPSRILAHLKELVGSCKLDGDIVALVEKNLDNCYLAATV